MSYVRIMVHCVWTTKGRIPFLRDQIRDRVISHVAVNANSKRVVIDCMNGFNDHLHALILLQGDQCISGIMHDLKGESSFWINKNQLTKLRFGWQDDFYAVSIGMDHFEKLRRYLKIRKNTTGKCFSRMNWIY